ncbi:hypothetical protein LEP1GSC170_6303 [Leptospira interrogans serovar Bataviae str. HAI135]|nr:hypothetical protein LEP1GSC170_6303 [Leptospira interrogans serovar Bataviae str. HAI135]
MGLEKVLAAIDFLPPNVFQILLQRVSLEKAFLDTLMDGRFRLQEKFDIVDIKFNKLNL